MPSPGQPPSLPPPTSSSSSSSPFSPPSSILIVGSGVFGLGTAYALTRRDAFSKTTITVLDRSPDEAVFPSRDASSVDSSRIVRADYADRAYAALAADALVEWRKSANDELGGQGRYSETGLVFTADQDPTATATATSAAAADATAPLPKKTGADYCLASWQNVVDLAKDDASLASKIRLLPNPDAIRDAVGTGGGSGVWGYINQASGWADASASMRFFYNRVRKTGRVKFVSGTAASLTRERRKVTGVFLDDGRTLSADLVILAAGAWTGGLVDLVGHTMAVAEVLAYMDITGEEQALLSRMPVLMNLSTGLFIITPSKNVLKVARHEHGFLNPTTDASPLRVPPSGRGGAEEENGDGLPYTVSLPQRNVEDAFTNIPEKSKEILRSALREMIPLPAVHERAFSKTRVCWYSNTKTGDFLVDYHPYWDGLFVATGGNGHAFKFLPVLGERIVDCVMQQRPAEFHDKWSWKASTTPPTKWNEIITDDGSRAGQPGLILQEELDRTS